MDPTLSTAPKAVDYISAASVLAAPWQVSIDEIEISGTTAIVTWSYLYDGLPRVSELECAYQREERDTNTAGGWYVDSGDAPEYVEEYVAELVSVRMAEDFDDCGGL